MERWYVLAATTHFAADTNDLFDARIHIAGHVPVVLAPVWLGHEHFNVLPQKLGRIVAKQTLGSRIDVLDEAPMIDG